MRVIVRFNGDGQGETTCNWLIPERFCFLDPLEEVSILGICCIVVCQFKGIQCRIELGNM